MPQHYLNFGGNFWSLAETEYILANPQFEVHYEHINAYPPASLGVPLSSAGAMVSGGGLPLPPRHAVGHAGDVYDLDDPNVVAELPPMHVLAPGTHASAASLSAVEEAPPLLLAAAANAAAATNADANELPKKKRMKALKFFDGVADAGPGGAGA